MRFCSLVFTRFDGLSSPRRCFPSFVRTHLPEPSRVDNDLLLGVLFGAKEDRGGEDALKGGLHSAVFELRLWGGGNSRAVESDSRSEEKTMNRGFGKRAVCWQS